ncbi:hypothetical protein PIL02S_06749 [Paenibacillus illinoisensis]|uniref:Uncharacterized protein n=1 Tax=Paenibacillus illinoisensis TaxID=59845 RepID=A0A2W0C9X6_9BACL|nr:hypothetical protein PIL02S_06749 [Paenibacillus illinoisensis]
MYWYKVYHLYGDLLLLSIFFVLIFVVKRF